MQCAAIVSMYVYYSHCCYGNQPCIGLQHALHLLASIHARVDACLYMSPPVRAMLRAYYILALDSSVGIEHGCL